MTSWMTCPFRILNRFFTRAAHWSFSHATIWRRHASAGDRSLCGGRDTFNWFLRRGGCMQDVCRESNRRRKIKTCRFQPPVALSSTHRRQHPSPIVSCFGNFRRLVVLPGPTATIYSSNLWSSDMGSLSLVIIMVVAVDSFRWFSFVTYR